jgi:DNA repair exonuclease SbcCD ATPase subunit
MPITHLTVNQKFSHVVQLSDIHIRLTKRHEEYKEVFSRLFNELLKTPSTTAIFVLGDVVNSKIDLSPECVDLAADFLFELASIRPTILVAGNHDTNLTNRNRMDSLSPIVDALNHPSLFYLKKSGLYGFGNICINNYSVFDSPDKYLKGSDIAAIYRNQYEYFVVNYHGQVDGAMTDIGFKLINPSVTVNMFDNHDIVFLGDVHKEQDLQIYDEITGKPAIRYAGSLIQQKHDEPIKGHGYSFWNLKQRDYVHSEISNDYGFFSILLDSGVISTSLSDIPKKARVRFQLQNTMPTEVKEALTHVRQLTEIVESCYEKLDSGVTLTRIPTANGNVVLGDINDKNYQMNLLKEFLKNKLKITDQSFIDGITKINDEMNDYIKKDDFARNIRWIPIKFEWENMFSYGEGNVLDFTKVKDLVGLFAENASGKSSIFSAMTFCLFDKCEREFKAANIMNVQKTSFSCKFEFEIDGKRYFIKRDGKADKKGKVKVDVRFWKIENGQEVDLNGEQRKDTNEIIREYLGSYDDFVLTSLSVQNGKNNASIIDMGDTDRKDLFSQFMGLTVFDRLYTEANERLREQLVALKTYRNDDYTQKLVNCTNLLGQAESFYRDESTALVEIGKKKDLVQEQILETTKKLVKIDVQIPFLSISELALSRAKSGLANAKDVIVNTEKSMEIVSGQLTTIESDIEDLENKKVTELSIKFQELTSQKRDIQNKREQMKLNYLNDFKIYEKSESIEYDPNCAYCVKNAGLVAIEAKEAHKRMTKIEEEVPVINRELESVEKQIMETKWAFDANLKLTGLLVKRNKLKDERIKLTDALNKLKGNLSKFEEEVKIHEKNIELYNKNSESIIFNESINKQIEEYNRELNQVDYSYKAKNRTLMDINSKISVCKNQISEINHKIDQIKIVEQKYKLYDVYCQAVSRDGIPFDVITATVPEIQNEVNNILGQVTDFTSLFETDGKNIIPYIVYNDKKWLMSLTSGFEKFSLSLAIRVALINISNLPRPNFLIIDEGFGVLDAENLASMQTLFSYLKTNFDFIMIVSHLESLRDIVDKHIEIIKDNGFSKVNFI